MQRIFAAPARLVRLTTAAVLAIATMSGVACSNDKPTGPSSHGIAGRYQLRTVDGQDIPATIHDGPWFDGSTTTFYDAIRVDALDGYVDLSNDGTFTASFTFRMSANGQSNTITVPSSGRYVQQNDVLQFSLDNGVTTVAPLADGQLTLEFDVLNIGTNDEFVLSK